MSITVLLGNTNPTSPDVDGNAVTIFQVPDGVKLVEAVTSITAAYDEYHSADPAEWVEATDPGVAAGLAEHWTWGEDEREVLDPDAAEDADPVYAPAHTCVVGRPDEWEGRGAELTLESIAEETA